MQIGSGLKTLKAGDEAVTHLTQWEHNSLHSLAFLLQAVSARVHVLRLITVLSQ